MVPILSIDFAELGFVFIVRFDSLKDLMTRLPIDMRDELAVREGDLGQFESGFSYGRHS